MRANNNKKSALTHILLALIPYSRQNLLLSYSPNRFFNELERKSGFKTESLKVAYKRGMTRGLISEPVGKPQLTRLGLRHIQPFVAKKLSGKAILMVIFDIPEQKSTTRAHLRRLLKSWGFEQVQKSVWSTKKDYREALSETITELQLEEHVQLYECVHLKE